MGTPLTLEFADGEFPFFLSLKGTIELQELTKVGIGALFGRVAAGQYKEADGRRVSFPYDAQFKVEDLTHTIRLALIGGGMDPVEAKRKVDFYCYPEQPLKPTWELAAAILFAAMEGFEIKPPQEQEAQKKRKTTTRKDGSTAARSTLTSRPSTNP